MQEFLSFPETELLYFNQVSFEPENVITDINSV
jgi:hypothetical protein